MMGKYLLRIPGHVACGPGAMEELAALLKGYAKAAVFTDRGIQVSGVLEVPLSVMQQAGIDYEVLSDLPSEPSAEQAEAVLRAYRKTGADVIVAVGGGSVMDTAKLAGALGRSKTRVRDMVKNPSLGKKTVKTIMIPTTAGTGSEATPNSIVALPEENLKVGIVSESLLADAAILDPVMIAKLPCKIAASTGMDALAHAIECFTSKKATPVSDLFALEALKMILTHIEAAVNEPDNMQAKEKMLLAAFYAGVAITASGTTAVHALSYPLGGRYHIPHGISNAILLLPVMRYNEPAVRGRFCAVHDALHPEAIARPEEEKSEWLLHRMEEILRSLSIPATLAAYNVGPEDLNELVQAGMKVTRLLNNNMREVTPEAAAGIYRAVL